MAVCLDLKSENDTGIEYLIEKFSCHVHVNSWMEFYIKVDKKFDRKVDVHLIIQLLYRILH